MMNLTGPQVEQALAIGKEILGPDSPHTFTMRQMDGLVFLRQLIYDIGRGQIVLTAKGPDAADQPQVEVPPAAVSTAKAK